MATDNVAAIAALITQTANTSLFAGSPTWLQITEHPDWGAYALLLCGPHGSQTIALQDHEELVPTVEPRPPVLPDMEDQAAIREWMLAMKASGNATSQAMTIQHAVGEMLVLFNLALWAGIANGEESDLAQNLQTSPGKLYDRALASENRQLLDQMELDDPNCSADTGQHWNPALDQKDN